MESGTAGSAEPAGLAVLLRQNVDVVISELASAEKRAGASLSGLVAARTVAEVIEDVTRVLVRQARSQGHTWAEIGALLRITRQAAQQRFSTTTVTAAPEHARLIGRANEIIEQLAAGQWQAATADWDARMRAKMSPADLGPVWEQVEDQVGPLRTIGRPSIVHKGPFRIADLPLAFERGPMKARVTFNDDDSIGGLWILLPDA